MAGRAPVLPATARVSRMRRRPRQQERTGVPGPRRSPAAVMRAPDRSRDRIVLAGQQRTRCGLAARRPAGGGGSEARETAASRRWRRSSVTARRVCPASSAERRPAEERATRPARQAGGRRRAARARASSRARSACCFVRSSGSARPQQGSARPPAPAARAAVRQSSRGVRPDRAASRSSSRTARIGEQEFQQQRLDSGECALAGGLVTRPHHASWQQVHSQCPGDLDDVVILADAAVIASDRLRGEERQARPPDARRTPRPARKGRRGRAIPCHHPSQGASAAAAAHPAAASPPQRTTPRPG